MEGGKKRGDAEWSSENQTEFHSEGLPYLKQEICKWSRSSEITLILSSPVIFCGKWFLGRKSKTVTPKWTCKSICVFLGSLLHSLSCCFCALLFLLPPSTNWSFSCLFYTGTDDGIYYRSQVITTQCQQCGSWTYNKFKMNWTHVHLRANYRFIIRNNCMQQKIYH